MGGATSEIMGDLLAFEADRRAVNITINRYVHDHNLAAVGGDVHLLPVLYLNPQGFVIASN